MKLDRLVLRYSNLYQHANHQVKTSPNALYVANAVESRLVIRHVSELLTIAMVYETVKPIDWIAWSPDSNYILTVNYQHARVDVYSLQDTKWHGVFKDGRIETICSVKWSSDSKNILYTDDLKLFSGVWNLSTGTLKFIEHLKYVDKCIEASPDGKYMAVGEKRQGKDYIGLYHSSSFIFVQGFEVDTVDFQNLKWSPDSAYIAVWDNCIYHKVLIYRQDGTLCKSYTGYQHNLGVKSVQWSPNGEMIAIGNYNQTVHMISTLTWDLIDILEHPTTITNAMITNVVEEITLPKPPLPSFAAALVEYQHVERRLHTLPTIRSDIPYPKIGISACQFSPDGLYMYSKNDHTPTTLWMWDVKTLQNCSSVVFKQPIRQMAWNPQQEHMLMVICGDENLHFIQPDNDALEMIPLRVPLADFSVKKFKWNPNGETILLMDGDLFCLALF